MTSLHQLKSLQIQIQVYSSKGTGNGFYPLGLQIAANLARINWNCFLAICFKLSNSVNFIAACEGDYIWSYIMLLMNLWLILYFSLCNVQNIMNFHLPCIRSSMNLSASLDIFVNMHTSYKCLQMLLFMLDFPPISNIFKMMWSLIFE